MSLLKVGKHVQQEQHVLIRPLASSALLLNSASYVYTYLLPPIFLNFFHIRRHKLRLTDPGGQTLLHSGSMWWFTASGKYCKHIHVTYYNSNIARYDLFEFTECVLKQLQIVMCCRAEFRHPRRLGLQRIII